MKQPMFMFVSRGFWEHLQHTWSMKKVYNASKKTEEANVGLEDGHAADKEGQPEKKRNKQAAGTGPKTETTEPKECYPTLIGF